MLNDLEARLAALEATVRQSKNASTRTEGYVNYRRQTDATPFPETQTFGGNQNTTLVNVTSTSGSSTVTWTTVDCSSYVPINAEHALVYFSGKRGQAATSTAYLQIRRDEQSDSVTVDAINLTLDNGFGTGPAFSGTFVVPLTTAGARTFQYQITGTITGLAYGMSLRGYHTRKKSASDANGGADGSGGGGGFDTGGAGL